MSIIVILVCAFFVHQSGASDCGGKVRCSDCISPQCVWVRPVDYRVNPHCIRNEEYNHTIHKLTFRTVAGCRRFTKIQAAIAAKSMRADVPIETIATTTVASLSFYHNNTGRDLSVIESKYVAEATTTDSLPHTNEHTVSTTTRVAEPTLTEETTTIYSMITTNNHVEEEEHSSTTEGAMISSDSTPEYTLPFSATTTTTTTEAVIDDTTTTTTTEAVIDDTTTTTTTEVGIDDTTTTTTTETITDDTTTTTTTEAVTSDTTTTTTATTTYVTDDNNMIPESTTMDSLYGPDAIVTHYPTTDQPFQCTTPSRFQLDYRGRHGNKRHLETGRLSCRGFVWNLRTRWMTSSCETLMLTMRLSIDERDIDLADYALDSPLAKDTTECFLILFRAKRCRPTYTIIEEAIDLLETFNIIY